MEVLREPVDSRLNDIRRAPWQVLLIVKWVCQDRYLDHNAVENISADVFNDLRQKLWELPKNISPGAKEYLPGKLFFRRLLNPQIGFQRTFSPAFVREASLLAQQPIGHPLRELFEKKIGISTLDFLDLTYATYAAILDGKRQFDLQWFEPLKVLYSDHVIHTFVSLVSRNFSELVAFCRSLPDAEHKVASEYFEFPILSRYPFFRSGSTIECWHPAVFYRGMENFVHSVLSEERQDYMDAFSKLFEKHVIEEAKQLNVPFLNEDTLRTFVAADTKVPDGLLSFPNCNIFIESKAGIFDQSIMTIGHSKFFSDRTRALKNAVAQAWATSVSLRNQKIAPSRVLESTSDYLLVVTNKELSASRGTALALMYPSDTLIYPNPEAEKLLPLEHIYFISVDDFERLIAGASNLDIPSFLRECVEADNNAETSVHFFEQHLDKRKVPRQFSKLVSIAIDDANNRLTSTFK